MPAFVVFAALALLPAIIVGLRLQEHYAAARGVDRMRTEAAKLYADWLHVVFVDRTVVSAAQTRFDVLNAKGFTKSSSAQDEMFLATLVIEGWHLK